MDVQNANRREVICLQIKIAFTYSLDLGDVKVVAIRIDDVLCVRWDEQIIYYYYYYMPPYRVRPVHRRSPVMTS
jgi:hypothetical protein